VPVNHPAPGTPPNAATDTRPRPAAAKDRPARRLIAGLRTTAFVRICTYGTRPEAERAGRLARGAYLGCPTARGGQPVIRL
jgi:hypothetical protein